MANAFCLFSSRAMAGIDPPSARKKATGAEGRAPRVALVILLTFFWRDLSMPLWPLQVTSDPCISVELTMASCKCRAEIGGTPCLDTMERSLFSAVLARFELLAACSAKRRRESR